MLTWLNMLHQKRCTSMKPLPRRIMHTKFGQNLPNCWNVDNRHDDTMIALPQLKWALKSERIWCGYGYYLFLLCRNKRKSTTKVSDTDRVKLRKENCGNHLRKSRSNCATCHLKELKAKMSKMQNVMKYVNFQ